MRYLFSSFVFLTVGLLAMSAMAEDKEGKKGDGDKRPEMREKMLKEFDADKDGKLSEDERAKAREKMQALRGAKGDRPRGDRPKGDRRDAERRREGRGPEGRGPEARDGERRGPGGPGGRPPMPKPEEMFAKFDKDGDDKLSKDEFMALTSFVREHMPPPPGGPRFDGRGPGGPAFGRGPDGPPRGDGRGPDGERRFERRDRPRDGDNPPPREDGRRRGRDREQDREKD